MTNRFTPQVRRLSRHSPLVTRHFCLAAALLLLSAPCAFSLDPSLDISQYAHTTWKVRDGFTRATITSIAQTPDGYLWLGTEFGLYRFDGMRAVPWQPPSGEQLASNNISALLVTRDGTLWIGTQKGLANWKNGKLTIYLEAAGQTISSLLQDPDGTVWFGSWPPGALCAVKASKVQCYAGGSLGRWVSALYQDRKGRLWVAAETGLWRWLPGVPRQYTFPYGTAEVKSLIENDDGTLLLATNEGLKQLVGGKIRSYALPGNNERVRPTHLFRSSDGSLWVGSQQGLSHVHQGKTDTFGAADGLSGDFIAAFLEDHEGDVWVSTLNGLDRFRGYAVPGISNKQGLLGAALSVQATPDGTVWISTTNGLNRWQNGRVTVYARQVAPSQTVRRGDEEISFSRAASDTANRGLHSTARSLGLDDQERLWVSTGDGIFYLAGDRFIRVPGAPRGNIWSIAADGHAKVWINDGSVGLFYLTPGEAVEPIPWSRFGQKGLGPEAMLPDPSNGGVWLGFNETGLAYFRGGEVRASYTAANGLGNGRVNDLRFDSHSTLWVATEGGLSQIKDGHVSTLTSKNGLPCDTVHWSVEDNDHFVWLYLPCGLVRVARADLDTWASDPKHILEITLFDEFDGVWTVARYGGYGPHMTKSPDGKIWFAGNEGVRVIDPRHLPHNSLPPPVHVEKITADDRSVDISNGMHLPTGVRHLDIDYTALSLVVPEKVRFRIKLEGEDKDWRELVNVRHVEYTNLPPKHYKFRVLACNNSGVWNEEGATLDFVIPPAWYQTNWFRALCVAAFLVLLWAIYQYRLHQLAQQFNMRLEERVGERTRIARDLHDTLLQSFHGILLFLQSGIHLLDEHPAEAKKTLKTAAEQAERAIIEGREAVQGLRASTVERNDLAAAIKTLGGELAAADSSSQRPEFNVQVEGMPRELHPILRDEVFRIAGEAMRNAFHHADAKQIEAEIRYDERQLRVRVRDDGKGIDAKLLSHDGREGHFGLRGMRERAKLIGGKLTVWSELDAGTEVELSIPANRAYTAPGDGQRSWLAEKLARFSGKDTELKS